MTKRLWAWLFSPAGITAVVCGLLLGIVLGKAGWDPFELIRIGTRFSQGLVGGSEGYDGQFFYYVARDLNPHSVASLLDVPAYRYQRILLPVLARLLSFGQAAWLPWALVLIGPVSHVVGVHYLSKLFERWGIRRWYALTYGLLLGCLLSIRLSLPEPLAFSLVIVAIWLQQSGRARLSWVLFGLALFAKETTMFFVIAQGLSLLFERPWKDAAGLALVAGLPTLLFRLWLYANLGSLGFGVGGAGATPLSLVPFGGLLAVGEYSRVHLLAVTLLYLPVALIPVVWGLWATSRKLLATQFKSQTQSDLFASLALWLNAIIFLFLPFALYGEPLGTLRLAVGLQLAVLLFAARFQVRRALNYSFMWIVLDVWFFV